MSLDVRAAALAIGADPFAGFRTGRTIAGGMEAGWRVHELTPLPGRAPGPRPPRLDDPVADTFLSGDRATR